MDRRPKTQKRRASAAADGDSPKRAHLDLGSASPSLELVVDPALMHNSPLQVGGTEGISIGTVDGAAAPHHGYAVDFKSGGGLASPEPPVAVETAGAVATAASDATVLAHDLGVCLGVILGDAADGHGNAIDSRQHSYAWSDHNLQFRVQNLPVLESFAMQLLGMLSKGPYQSTLAMVTEQELGPGQNYATVRALFDQIKRAYSEDEPFLSAADLGLFEPHQAGILRKANLATWVSSVFGGQDVGFYHLHEAFLDTFVPEGGRLLKSQGGIFLELKTQAYISAMSNGQRSRQDILNDLFPNDLKQRVLNRRMGAKALNPSELDFVKRAGSRRDRLLAEPNTAEALAALPEKYVWEDFLRDVSSYLRRYSDDLIMGSGQKTPKPRNSIMAGQHFGSQSPPHGLTPMYGSSPPPEQLPPAGLDAGLPMFTQPYHSQEVGEPELDFQDVVARATQAARAVLRGESTERSDPQGQEHETPAAASAPAPVAATDCKTSSSPRRSDLPSSLGGVPEVRSRTPSVSTQALYQQARAEATVKPSPEQRRSGVQSQRRPWTTEEENTLMAGLDLVKGPHWSQILAMFGAGGTINEVLKGRTQVQLKDKARNLKLFFLKSGIEVPYYLQSVTGELKTRAPNQVARHVAREKNKFQDDEDRARIEGVLALVGGSLAGAGNGAGDAPATNGTENRKPQATDDTDGDASGNVKDDSQRNISDNASCNANEDIEADIDAIRLPVSSDLGLDEHIAAELQQATAMLSAPQAVST